MTLGEKLKEARLAMNLSQTELAKLTGISERSLYTYEQLGITPRKSNVKKLAAALNVSASYLMGEDQTDTHRHIDEEMFVASAKSQYGAKGAREAQEVLGRTRALFAGGVLDEDAKDVFFRAIMEVYLDSKADASAKFTPEKYREHKETDQ